MTCLVVPTPATLPDVEQGVGKAVIDCIPRQRSRAGTRLNPYALAQLRPRRSRNCSREESLFISVPGKQPIFPIADHICRGRIIESHHAQPAGKSFKRHVSVGFGQAGKEKDVRRRIMTREIFVPAYAGEMHLRELLLERLASRAV